MREPIQIDAMTPVTAVSLRGGALWIAAAASAALHGVAFAAAYGAWVLVGPEAGAWRLNPPEAGVSSAAQPLTIDAAMSEEAAETDEVVEVELPAQAGIELPAASTAVRMTESPVAEAVAAVAPEGSDIAPHPPTARRQDAAGRPTAAETTNTATPLPRETTDRAPTTVMATAASAPAVAQVGAQTAASPIFSPSPDYPPELLAARVGGLVKLRVTLDAAGKVIDARVEKTSGYGAFDRSALAVIRRWRFTPVESGKGTASDKPRELIVPIRFGIVANPSP